MFYPRSSRIRKGTARSTASYSRTDRGGAAQEKENTMWAGLAVVIIILWLLGAFAFHVAGGLIHLLLVLAVIALILHFVRGRAV
jgi:hypothetical protein